MSGACAEWECGMIWLSSVCDWINYKKNKKKKCFVCFVIVVDLTFSRFVFETWWFPFHTVTWNTRQKVLKMCIYKTKCSVFSFACVWHEVILTSNESVSFPQFKHCSRGILVQIIRAWFLCMGVVTSLAIYWTSMVTSVAVYWMCGHQCGCILNKCHHQCGCILNKCGHQCGCILNKYGHQCGCILNECGHQCGCILNKCGHHCGCILDQCGHQCGCILNKCGHQCGCILDQCGHQCDCIVWLPVLYDGWLSVAVYWTSVVTSVATSAVWWVVISGCI